MSRYLTPYGQEREDRWRRAWPLALFWGPVLVVTIAVMIIADVVAPRGPKIPRKDRKP